MRTGKVIKVSKKAVHIQDCDNSKLYKLIKGKDYKDDLGGSEVSPGWIVRFNPSECIKIY